MQRNVLKQTAPIPAKNNWGQQNNWGQSKLNPRIQ